MDIDNNGRERFETVPYNFMAGLKGKRILITAGPTWVPIDKVRVISNIATGRTGILLAEEAQELDAKVMLLIGPVAEPMLGTSIETKRFCYFDELHRLVKSELRKKKYDIVIHCAAVSDFKPKKSFSGKIKTKKDLSLELESTLKIVDKIKKYDSGVFLVIFKLELLGSKNKMIETARKTMKQSRADIVVVNTLSPYRAWVIDRERIFCSVDSKEKLVKRLLQTIGLMSNGK